MLPVHTWLPALELTAPTNSISAEPCHSNCCRRFFAEACATLVCQVFGRRKRSPRALAAAAAASADSAAATAAAGDPAAPTAPSVFDYYITDGLYGSFNCVMYDHAEPTARPLRCPTLEKPDNGVGGAAAEQLYPSTVFGPSCDGLDTLFQVTIATPLNAACTLLTPFSLFPSLSWCMLSLTVHGKTCGQPCLQTLVATVAGQTSLRFPAGFQ